MKISKGSIVFILFALLLKPLAVQAQDTDQMKRYREEKMKFFNDKLQLSEDEAKQFWPVYEDLHNRRMKINEDERNLLNYYSSNADFMSDKEVDETIQKYLDLQKARVDLDLKYHDTFVNIIGKKKTMRMYSLEREFRIYILKKFRGGHGGGPQGPGPHNGGR